jgi:hypothetical protein
MLLLVLGTVVSRRGGGGGGGLKQEEDEEWEEEEEEEAAYSLCDVVTDSRAWKQLKMLSSLFWVVTQRRMVELGAIYRSHLQGSSSVMSNDWSLFTGHYVCFFKNVNFFIYLVVSFENFCFWKLERGSFIIATSKHTFKVKMPVQVLNRAH